MPETTTPEITDRVTTRTWELDLALAGRVYSPKIRPARRKRQQIVRFVGREGTIERFTIRQTIPHPGYEAPCPPSQSQYGAVCDFFAEPCETSSQAKTLLSARDYAEVVARSFSFTAARWDLIWHCTAAFILSDTDLRSRVKAWSIASWKNGYGEIAAGIGNHKPYKRIEQFARKLVDDMRGAGAAIFG